jgi:hypothetical protein
LHLEHDRERCSLMQGCLGTRNRRYSCFVELNNPAVLRLRARPSLEDFQILSNDGPLAQPLLANETNIHSQLWYLMHKGVIPGILSWDLPESRYHYQ